MTQARFMLKWIAKLAFSVALLGLLLSSVNIDQLTERLSSIHIGALSLASLLIVIAIVLRAYRWRVITLAYGGTLSLWTSFQLIQMGNFVGQVLPASIGGDVVRAWGGYRSGLALRVSIHTILLDRIFGFGTLLIITLLAVPGLFFLIDDTAMLAVLGSFALVGLLVLSGIIMVDKVAAWLPWAKLRQEVEFLSSDARKFIGKWNASIPVVFASVITHLLSIVAVMIIASGIGVIIPLYELVLLLPPVMFLTMMPFSMAGWGIREGAMVFALGYIGVPREEAFAISVLMGIVAMIVSLPGGAFMIKDMSWRMNRNEEPLALNEKMKPCKDADRVNND